MRRILAPLITCSLLALAGPASANGALGSNDARSYQVLKQELQKELSPRRWDALQKAPFRRFSMRERWRGEHLDGFVKKGSGTPRKKVEYLWQSDERAPYRLTIKDGLLYDATGKRFGTGVEESHLVMDVHGNLYGREFFDKATAKKWAHSSYVAGEDLFMSLEITAKHGRVTFLKNRSGHYRPGRLAFFHWLLAMERAGLDLSQAEVAFDRKSAVEEEDSADQE